MERTIAPPISIRGTVTPAGDKSISHRAAIFNAIAGGEATVENFQPGADCKATLRCLQALGVDWKLDQTDVLVIKGAGLGGLRESNSVLNCGNSGTIDRADVLTVSIHADPVRFYPFFWGHADEQGVGDGEGFNINLPLARGTGDDEYLRTLDSALDSIKHFSPEALVIALGLDAFERDPLSGLAISTAGFSRIGKRIGSMALPSVIVQEGGYLTEELGLNLSSFLEGFMSSHSG